MKIGQAIETKGKIVRLRIIRNSVCSSCHACTMESETKVVELYALNLCNAREKDRVEIHLEMDSFLTAVRESDLNEKNICQKQFEFWKQKKLRRRKFNVKTIKSKV